LTALIDAEWYETAMALSVKANNTGKQTDKQLEK